jgi:hypothetical protein
MADEPMKSELEILLDGLRDGLRQEVRQRKLAYLVTDQDFSIVNEREIGIASFIALQLRSLGFAVQLDAYFHNGDERRRPDFGIWLPASKKYIYLELKQIAWGDEGKQYYSAKAIEEIKKLNGETDPLNRLNGLIAFGLSSSSEKVEGLLSLRLKELSQTITSDYPYEEIGLRHVDFQGMDKKTSYGVIGLWFRKQ